MMEEDKKVDNEVTEFGVDKVEVNPIPTWSTQPREACNSIVDKVQEGTEALPGAVTNT